MITGRPLRVALASIGAITTLACASASSTRSAPLVVTTSPASPVGPLVVHYPDMLRSANVEGQVIVDVAVDTAGKLDWAHTSVLTRSHELFVVAVKRGLNEVVWRAATRSGAPVPGLWRDTVDFRLEDDQTPCEIASAHRHRVCGKATARPDNRSMSVDERQRLLAQLRTGRERWRRERPTRYRIEVTENAGMIAYVGTPSRIIADVAGESIVRVERTPATDSRVVSKTMTVEQLFAWAEDHIRTTRARVDALELDPRYGYLRRLHSDIEATSDSETDLRVQTFAPLP